ncbi:hypothetical protein HYPSUDRAFT_781786 [Hypholoma sublateritium FD-334 SS-4]|uniref:Uncharacterized protein n=1 Tax=Hypholoma sublateritium (strain FD-334 SS-4) TaxID=945553 RepID=A0A0D2NP94_HYPSF|nr:hypothetical protein HYPSUDRAFT_781786 [Hypholoma sublateritium FD-334 SS-4]
MVDFPAPVGGTALPPDFVPSIIFSVLYATLTPLMLYRMFHKRSRSVLLIGTVAFSVERVVIFTLRAIQSRNEGRRLSPGLVTYMQISFGMGFIGIANDIVNLVRCLLVNPTYGFEMYAQSSAAVTKDGLMPDPPIKGTSDHPKLRQWIRRGAGIIALAFFGALVPGILANSNYSKVFTDQHQADMTAHLRVVSTAVALALTIMLFLATLWGKLKLPRITHRGVLVICAMSILIRTTSLLLDSVLDTSSAKAAFYVFHVLPEWLASLILFTDNTRKTFGTGPFGDWRIRDETEKQRKKREAKNAKKNQGQLSLLEDEEIECQNIPAAR